MAPHLSDESDARTRGCKGPMQSALSGGLTAEPTQSGPTGLTEKRLRWMSYAMRPLQGDIDAMHREVMRRSGVALFYEPA